jgi:hypothetical protein
LHPVLEAKDPAEDKTNSLPSGRLHPNREAEKQSKKI